MANGRVSPGTCRLSLVQIDSNVCAFIMQLCSPTLNKICLMSYALGPRHSVN